MEFQNALAGVERKIAEGRKLWESEVHMQKLYDAQKKGLDQAKVDAGKAVRLGTDVVQFMRNQLQMMESSSAWSMPQSSFEQAVSMRVGYKAAVDAVQKLLAQERLRVKDASRTGPDRPANESSL
jgi:hypothetical protein